MSWIPPEVSSTKVRIALRMLVANLSPTLAIIRPRAVRVCSMDINSDRSQALNTRVSATLGVYDFYHLTHPQTAGLALTGR